MKIYRSPASLRAILFDVDGTLYTNPAYVEHQKRVLIEKLAAVKDWPYEEALAQLDGIQARVLKETGKTTSLGNLMQKLGVSINTSIEWRQKLIRPEDYLRSDPILYQNLEEFVQAGIKLAIVTNNPRSVGLATLDALGVASLFSSVTGLDDTGISKPAREPYALAARKLGVAAVECMSVGDRYDIDLALPLEMGMGAVLVNGADEIVKLAKRLEQA